MTDLTLDDLAGGAGGDDGGSGGGGDGGDFILEAIDKLDSKGILKPLVLGEEREIEEIKSEPVPDGGAADQQADVAEQIDSAKIKGLLLEVYDNTGMIPGLDDDPQLSEIIKLVDSNPEMVDKLIEERL